MKPFRKLTAIAAPLIRDNVDTDQIIPSREMKTVGRSGLADGLFAGSRYTEVGGREPDPAFVLNDPRYRAAEILLSGANFGCGSSREHAAWALAEYGFRAVIAPSFNPIFRGNCVRNGIVPVELPPAAIRVIGASESPITVDLERMMVSLTDGFGFPFRIEEEAREMLLEGLDGIELTLRHRGEIETFIVADRATRPWAYTVEDFPPAD